LFDHNRSNENPASNLNDLSQGVHWKEALKILKLAVTRSSTLVAPPSSSASGSTSGWGSDSTASSFSESELFLKKELPGTWDL